MVRLPRIARLSVVSGSLWLLALVVIGASRVCAATTAGGVEYSFAMTPQFEQRKLFVIWKPIADELEKRTGLRLKLMTTLTISEFERELATGALDFAYINAYHVMRQGYIPLVRDAAPLKGVLVVAKDSPINALADLNGKLLAVPSPNAFGASLLVRAELERFHHVKMRLLNAKTHSSVYLHVIQGLVDAGGGVDKTLQEQTQAIRESLRILYVTRDAPSHPISAHPRVPPDVRDKIQAALLAMGATAEGAALLARIPMSQVVPASVKDYQQLGEMGLEAFWVEGAP
jgi:phosphonate transport system substrate-binding protein